MEVIDVGPSQVRNQLRRHGIKVSIHTVRCVLEEHGYVAPRVRRKEGPDQRFEAARPNQLWHLNFLHSPHQQAEGLCASRPA